jgi:4-alpha-glucanotransferase
MGVVGGAPPDSFFTAGQTWGFPPLHPLRLREQHYEYLIRVLRHHLRQAHLLRLDHVMGLHRLFWVPDGMPASQGVYVRYPAEELYAVALLEAHRCGASLVGENLGTVPSYVNRAMRHHRLGRMFVFQYEVHADPHGAMVRMPDADEVASLNTHDMPTFASWWQGRDIDDRMALGLLTESEAEQERAGRQELRRQLVAWLRSQGAIESPDPELPEILAACLRWLAASDARLLLVNVEDLWLETEPQNTPGTLTERANWRRKARLSLDEFTRQPEVSRLLAELAALRRK